MFLLSNTSSPSNVDELCCFLCKNTFNEPLILSCGHSFCRQCVQPWLRRATACPLCRCPTLQPIPNTTMTQKVFEFKKIDAEKSNFIRNAIRRTFHSSKEAKTLQREALRASQRRPKNVVMMTKKTAEGKVVENGDEKRGQKQRHKCTTNVEKEFVPIDDNKIGVEQQKEKDNASEGQVSVRSFRSATTCSPAPLLPHSPPSPASEREFMLILSSVGSLQTEIRRAFSAHLNNVQNIELFESKKSPAELIDAIEKAQKVVMIYRTDQSESFERIRKPFEYFLPKTLNTMKEKGKISLIGLIIGRRSKNVDRSKAQKLADLLGSQFSEIEVTKLEQKFLTWAHFHRPNWSSIERPLQTIEDEFRPAMGLSGSAMRKQQKKKKMEIGEGRGGEMEGEGHGKRDEGTPRGSSGGAAKGGAGGACAVM